MIHLKNLSFAYRQLKNPFKPSKTIIKDISLEISSGSICGILGKNGEGKTTLFRLISGLLFPQQGICRVAEYEPRKRQQEFLSQLFFLPEEPRLPNVKIGTYFDAYSAFYPNYNIEQEAECLKAFDLDRSTKLHSISMGQRKKAAIVFAIAANTPILLLDEPTNGLDIPSKAIFRRIISAHINDERTILISTHQIRELEQLIDDVIVLDSNKILIHNRVTEIEKKLYSGKVIEGLEPIYSEGTTLGEFALYENLDECESNVSLELLFNALMANPSPILSLLK